MRPAHKVKLRGIQSEKTLAKIQATKIVQRLQQFALGDPSVEMSSAQVKAAQVLLAKILPDMTHRLNESVTEPMNAEQQFLRLVERVGAETARLLYPDMARQYLDRVAPDALRLIK